MGISGFFKATFQDKVSIYFNNMGEKIKRLYKSFCKNAIIKNTYTHYPR